MRQVILFLSILTLILSGINRLNAQSNSLYFLKGVPQSKDLNPAHPGMEQGFYFSVPIISKLDISFNTNNWSYSDLIHAGNGVQADSLVWDFKNFIGSLDENNFVMESAALTLFEGGRKKGKNFYGFSWAEREYAEFFFTKNLADILYYGNVPYLGTTYHSGYFGGGTSHYRELSFSYAREVNKKLSVGISGKVLFGLAGAKSSGLNFVAGMPVSGDQVDLRFSGKAYLSAPYAIDIITNNGYHVATKNNFDKTTYFSNFGNPGLAVDLGLSNKVSDNLTLSVSLVDLGFISWTKDNTILTENGHFLFRGINLNTVTPTNNPPAKTDVRGLLIALRDSVKAAFFPQDGTAKFTTLLPVKLYIAGEYAVNENVSLGGVSRIRMFNNMLHTSFTASANFKPSKGFSFSASYSIAESTYDNLGLAAACQIGKVQLYAASDNLFALTQPAAAHNMNLRVGINLIYKDSEKRRKSLRHKR